jgi:hypothetical protein
MDQVNGSVATPMFGTKEYNVFSDQLEYYKTSARRLMRPLGFNFRFVQRHPADTEPIIEIWNGDEDTLLIEAGLAFPNNGGPVLLHLQKCGKMGSDHNHHAWGRELKSLMDVYKCIVDEMNILREHRCVREDNPT